MSLPVPAVRRILPFLLGAGLGGWGGLTPAGPLDDAQSAWRAGDLRTATIVLKERLQRDPNDPAARVLLAQVYLDSANPGGAQQELERALRLSGVDADSTLLPMAKALLELGQGTKLLAKPEPAPSLPAATRAELLALRGDARLAARDPQGAGREYGRALELAPTQPRALLGQAKLALSQDQTERTEEALAAAVAANPTDAQTAVLAGDFAYLQGRPGDAEADYSRALEYATNRWLVQYKRALARLELGQFDGAQEDIEAAEAGLAEFIGVHYARGLLAFRRGQYEPALAELELFLQAAPQDQSAAYYAAASLYQLKRYAQAEQYLTVLLNVAPGLISAANLLAATRLETGDAAGAEAVLAPFAGADQARAETLRLYARALDALGRGAEAQQTLSRASAAAPDDAATRLALAVSQLKAGNPGAARAAAESIVASHPDDVKARILLVRSAIDQDDAKAAVSAAEELAQRAPHLAQVQFVLGVAQHAAKDDDAARRSFARALELEPGDPESAFALAALDLREGRPEQARRLYEQVLAARPTVSEAVLKLAQLDVTQGQRAAALDRLSAALAKDPGNLALRLNIARGYLSAGLIPETQRALQDLPPTAVTNPEILLLKAQVNLAAGLPFTAIPLLEQLVRLQPGSADVRFMLATAFAVTKNLSGMQEQLLAGYQLDPKSPLANQTLNRVYAALPDIQSRSELLGKLMGRDGADDNLLLLQARLLIEAGEYPDALQRLADLYRAKPQERAVFIEFLTAQVKTGELLPATQTAQAWVTAHPDDHAASALLGDIYVRRGRLEEALETYRALVRTVPQEPTYNNNLAQLLVDKQPAEALIYAKAAAAAAPDDPTVTATLGTVLLAAGDAKGAVAAMARAQAAAPTDPTVAYHYAAVLAATGDAAQARKVLLPVMNKSFADKDKAQALLQRLLP